MSTSPRSPAPGSERGQPPFNPTMMTALLLFVLLRHHASRRIAGVPSASIS
jgi:hypothetical protein